LGNGVCGQTDDRSFAQQPTRGRRWQIILTDMNACRTGQARDVSAVVDDDGRAVGTSEPYRLVGEIEKRR
jgi:hypothetical protein